MAEPLLPMVHDHPDRRPLVDELHARPFTPLTPPALAASIAMATDGVSREDVAAHLAGLLRELGVDDAPELGLNHAIWTLGALTLRWERHTEFVSYTFTLNTPMERPFDVAGLEAISKDWLAAAPGGVISAVLMQLEMAETVSEAEERFLSRFAPHFAAESFASAWIAGRQALAMSDFRIDDNGFVRFAVIGLDGVGPRRLGRLSQRLNELETYRALSMRALPVARSLSPRLSEIERAIAGIVAAIDAGQSGSEDASRERALLAELTAVSATLERIASDSAFRFSAANAYQAIVNERLDVLRQERALERQTFSEFMVRRFKPAMRTCRSAEDRLAALAARAERAANLLRTRVDVSLEAQNQALLESMNRRAELQLRLQQTVEGLSVVAISYYAVSLAGYLLAPFAEAFNASPKVLTALIAVPIIVGVFLFVRRLRRKLEKRKE